MRSRELGQARASLARLIEQATRDLEDLRRCGKVTARGVASVEELVETARRADDILRLVASNESTTGSRHDAGQSDPDAARGGE